MAFVIVNFSLTQLDFFLCLKAPKLVSSPRRDEPVVSNVILDEELFLDAVLASSEIILDQVVLVNSEIASTTLTNELASQLVIPYECISPASTILDALCIDENSQPLVEESVHHPPEQFIDLSNLGAEPMIVNAIIGELEVDNSVMPSPLIPSLMSLPISENDREWNIG